MDAAGSRRRLRAHPVGRQRLTELDLLLQDEESGSLSDGCDDHDSDDDASDVSAVVVSRVHAGIASLNELHRGSSRVPCARVEQLNVFGNRLTTLDGLQRFTRLQELCLSNNQIEELSFHELDPLKLLRVLDLSANRLSSLRGLPLLPRLEELSLAHNRLTGLEGLLRPVKLPKLRYMDVRGNQLASPVALVPLQHLKRLAHLRLQSQDGAVSNPICDVDGYPEAILEFLPTLKQLDEEDVVVLRELSRVRMPKYQSAARRIQINPGRGVDGSSQTTPAKPGSHHRGELRVFAESRERVGYEVRSTDTRSPVVTAGPITPKAQASATNNSVAAPEKNPRPQDTKPEAQLAPPMRVVLREVSTNTEMNFEKAILDRETVILEKQATILAREQEFLQKESEFFAREKHHQEAIRHLQGQLSSAMEHTAKLEVIANEKYEHLEAKLRDMERLHEQEHTSQTDHAAQLDQLQEQISRLKHANESLSTELENKQQRITRLEDEASRSQSQATASAKDVSTRVLTLEAALEEAEERCRKYDHQLKSQQASNDAATDKLSQQLARVEHERDAQAKQIEQIEQRLHEMKTSRDQYRDECLQKDDDLYRLKKALSQKSEEVEEVRVQLMKAAERQDRIQLQQQQLYEKQLQASVMQIEMEFRREHQQATAKLQSAYRKIQESTHLQQRMKGSYESSLKREALLKDEIHRLSSIIEGDKQKLVDQELTKRAEYEFKIQRLQDEKQALQDELLLLKQEREKVATLEHELKDTHRGSEQLREEINRLQGEIQTWASKEGNWKAALKVKDTMLNDQMRQLEELRKQNKKLEEEYQQDTGEFQGQIEDLEEALDESLEKVSRIQEKYDRAKTALAEKEQGSAKYDEKLDDMTKQIELKNAALELIESEMDRMRETLSKQDDLFQKRLQKHLEQHRGELEQSRGSREELEARLRAEFEDQRADMERKYDKLADDLKDMAAQNTKLRVTLDQERKKIHQSDREIRVLLAQLDRERHIKNERLGDIKRLFEQLQRETP